MSAEPDLVRNPAREAQDVVDHQYVPHVLEPSPPAVDDGDWFADDPVALAGGPALVPHGMDRPGAMSWSEWLSSNPDRSDWVTQRWLGGDRRLPVLPDNLIGSRTALHRLAAYVIAPERHRATGKFGLRWTLGGFGTPFFGDNRQIRVSGTELIDQRAGQARSTPLTSLQNAADFLEAAIDPETAAEHDSPSVGDVNEPLDIEPGAAAFLGDWFAMAFAALEVVRDQRASVDPSRPQLWPGHFDPAIELGDQDRRGSYGASPGDAGIDEPYLYVSVWYPDRLDLDENDPVWNAPSFTGAVLRHRDFPPGDPVMAAAAFFVVDP